MKLRIFQWLLVPAVLATANALFGWGSLTLLDDLGPIATRSAQRQAPLTWAFMNGGRFLIDVAGMDQFAKARAESLFAPARPVLLADPILAMDRLHRGNFGFGHRLLIWSHWAAPWLWLATIVAYAMRQRQVITTRSIR